jgi:hypothetical protein
MADFDNNMRGVLFQNDKAKDTQPDYKGSCEIDGKQYWLSGWKKLSKDNKPFLSLAIQEKEVVTEQSGYEKAKQARDSLQDTTDYDSPPNLQDIPF